MQLTRLLCFYKKYTKTPGQLFLGKNRVTKSLSAFQLKNALKWMLMEEDNIKLLSNPYITKEEERSHMVDGGFKQKRKDEGYAKFIAKKKFKEDRTLSEHLEHLNVEKKWE